jgi:hypothetical protein
MPGCRQNWENMNSSNPGTNLPNTHKLRFAICLSGQARHWRKCVDNIKLFFGNTYHPDFNMPIEVDYFIHTWDTNTWRFPKQPHYVFQTDKHNDGPDIQSAFCPQAMEFEEWDKEKYPRAWDSMFYSFAKSLMLKREYELQNNFQYDVVVKARLDVVYNPRSKFPLTRILPKCCYTGHMSVFPLEFNYINFDDVIYYGDSPTMDIVGDLYHTYKMIHSKDMITKARLKLNLDPTTYYGPGCLLYEHMINSGILPDRRHGIDYAVMRSTIVEKNLDAITQYDEVKQTWIEWYH